MRPSLRAIALVLALGLVPAEGRAQEASLVADRISVEGDGALVAEGNVEVLYDGTRLTATRVRYDREADRLTIDGPLLLNDGVDTIILASSAELSPSLRGGILNSARLVLDRQLQIAAQQIDRTGDRFMRMSRVVASSCEICEGGTPLWELRASRVVRDEKERQLYFNDAQFRVIGLPVFYLPRLRLPDPTLERADGFLVPSIRSRSELGTGIVTPYFVTIGDHADITFSPYVSSATRTLGIDYRQELSFGRYEFEGAVSDDDLDPESQRFYLFGEGVFDLPEDFTLRFDLQLVSDDSYVYDYDITDDDRLESGLELSRTRDDQFVLAEALSFRTLRASELENESELPSELIDFSIAQRLFEDPDWGQAWVSLSGSSAYRNSDEPVDGRDTTRLTGKIGWDGTRLFGPGLVAEGEALLSFDQYFVNQDPDFDGAPNRLTPAIAGSLAWPLQRDGEGGVRHLLEPKVQLVWSETDGDEVPNEDSTVVELDEGNLFSLSRFPGEDRHEDGLRANLGLSWTRYDPDGWSVALTGGRIVRFDDRDQFDADSGISGGLSNWMLGGVLKVDDRLDLISRTLLDDNFDISRSETRLTWRDDVSSLSGTHLWQKADESEDRVDDLSELTLRGTYRLADYWTATGNWRFNADAGETTKAGVGVRYENECVAVRLSLSRRFTSSRNVNPATDVDLQVSLSGFGTGARSRAVRRTCKG